MAKDLHVLSLKEQIHVLNQQVMKYQQWDMEMIQHFTGLARAREQQTQPAQMMAVPRTNTLGSRIARAERLDRESAKELTAQRRKEYEERIASLMRPETEVMGESENAVQESRTE